MRELQGENMKDFYPRKNSVPFEVNNPHKIIHATVPLTKGQCA